MSMITIDSATYEVELLSAETRDNIHMLQHTDQEIQRLEMMLAMLRTARIGYAAAVKKGIETYARLPEGKLLQ